MEVSTSLLEMMVFVRHVETLAWQNAATSAQVAVRAVAVADAILQRVHLVNTRSMRTVGTSLFLMQLLVEKRLTVLLPTYHSAMVPK